MILITRATTNSISATCREKSVLLGTKYVIKFISDTKKSGDSRYCYVTDTSSYPERYQTFSVVETTTPTQITNQVKLDISRSWKYTIFEVTASYMGSIEAWTSFSEFGLTTVETGRVKVVATPATKQTYTSNRISFKEYVG